jgi:hypothetical protein
MCVKVKEQIDQCVWDNRRISNDETTSVMTVTLGNKLYKSGLMPNQEHFIPMKSRNVRTIRLNALKFRAIM